MAGRRSPGTRCSGALRASCITRAGRPRLTPPPSLPGDDDLRHEITGLTNGTEHFVRVLAVNAVDDGEPSDGEPFTPATTPGAPHRCGRGAGRPVDVGHLGRGRRRRLGRHRIQGAVAARRQQLRGLRSPRRQSADDAQSRQITGLDNGTEYFVQVMAINDVGDGGWSSPASATPARVAGPPTRVVAVRGDAVGDGHLGGAD